MQGIGLILFCIWFGVFFLLLFFVLDWFGFEGFFLYVFFFC